MAKRGAPHGNKNARLGKSPGLVIRLDVATADLLRDVLALDGNTDPTREDLQNAVYYAVRRVYGRKQEDNAIIL